MENDPRDIPLFSDGESISDKSDRLARDQSDGWRDIKKATLATASGVLVLSFLLLQIPDRQYEYLLIAAWIVLTIGLMLVFAVYWIEILGQTQSRSMLSRYGSFAQLGWVARVTNQPADPALLTVIIEELQEEQKRTDDRLSKLSRMQLRSYLVANIVILTGIGLLVAFGIANILAAPSAP